MGPSARASSAAHALCALRRGAAQRRGHRRRRDKHLLFAADGRRIRRAWAGATRGGGSEARAGGATTHAQPSARGAPTQRLSARERRHRPRAAWQQLRPASRGGRPRLGCLCELRQRGPLRGRGAAAFMAAHAAGFVAHRARRPFERADRHAHRTLATAPLRPSQSERCFGPRGGQRQRRCGLLRGRPPAYLRSPPTCPPHLTARRSGERWHPRRAPRPLALLRPAPTRVSGGRHRGDGRCVAVQQREPRAPAAASAEGGGGGGSDARWAASALATLAERLAP